MGIWEELHGAEESAKCADPYFKPKERVCNRPECDTVFTTTPLRRMFCSRCYQLIRRIKISQTIKVSKATKRIRGSE